MASTPFRSLRQRSKRYSKIIIKLPNLSRRAWPNRPVRRRRTMLFALARRLKTHWQASNGVNKTERPEGGALPLFSVFIF